MANIENPIAIVHTGVDTSDATATAGDIMSGETAYVDGVKITGNYTPPAPAVLTTKNITANGTYAASGDSADGYSSVTVNIPNTVLRGILDKTIQTITADDLAGVTFIGNYAIYQCFNLKSVSFPSNLTRLGISALMYCSKITSLVIPDSVEIINADAFRLMSGTNTGLQSITIGSGIRLIGSTGNNSAQTENTLTGAVFAGDDYLTSVTLNCSQVPVLLERANVSSSTRNFPSGCTIYVPASLYTQFQTATNWAYYYANGQIVSQ